MREWNCKVTSGYLKFMYPLIYRLQAEFNLSEMQAEGRQLERTMIADVSLSGSQYILFQCPNGDGE